MAMKKFNTIALTILITVIVVFIGLYILGTSGKKSPDTGKPVVPAVQQTAAQTPPVAQMPTSTATQPAAQTPKLDMIFDGKDLGYTISYPSDLTAERPDPKSSLVMISGKQGTEAYDATINIQNLMTTKTGGKYTDADSVVKDMQAQVKAGAKDVKYPMETRDVSYTTQKGVELKGKQFVVEYTRDGKTNRQWQVILPRPEGGYIYLLAYTAPAAIFDKYSDLAQAIIQSWNMSEK